MGQKNYFNHSIRNNVIFRQLCPCRNVCREVRVVLARSEEQRPEAVGPLLRLCLQGEVLKLPGPHSSEQRPGTKNTKITF